MWLLYPDLALGKETPQRRTVQTGNFVYALKCNSLSLTLSCHGCCTQGWLPLNGRKQTYRINRNSTRQWNQNRHREQDRDRDQN
ncbi:hypothetical protein EVAR_39939_1 [Eumeta japonica]|uniref:Uncharacterized protein n=1 Tax=Eumeta variegata TaxID=151549 RepID=A0A4C1X2G3_EUMVA|nr:hypothetical protein EVAR_39939_1 [Eumeta japonica]